MASIEQCELIMFLVFFNFFQFNVEIENMINDVGAIYIAEALIMNVSLREIHLQSKILNKVD